MSIEEEIITLRRNFHKCAEIGWLEFETTINIIKYLSTLDFTISYGKKIHSCRMGLPDEDKMKIHINELKENNIFEHLNFPIGDILEGYTGVVATLHSGNPGPTIALRFDIDSNEISEAKDNKHIPYRKGFSSHNSGMMHACGHDAHIAIGLQIAKTLSQMKEKLKGNIILIFQPAEEGVRGAKSLVDAGVLKGVDYLFSGHIGFMAKMGEVICNTVGFLSTSKLDVYYYGKSAHAGACPEKGRNALLAGANCAINLHTLTQFSQGMSRINVGTFNSGTARNIVPAFSKLEIETRGENEEINKELIERAKHIVKACSELYEVDYKIEEVGGALAYSSNNHEFVEGLMNTLKETGLKIIKTANFGASEDITYMLKAVEEQGGKGTYMIFGTDLKETHHNKYFDIDEKSLLNAYNCYIAILKHLLWAK